MTFLFFSSIETKQNFWFRLIENIASAPFENKRKVSLANQTTAHDFAQLKINFNFGLNNVW